MRYTYLILFSFLFQGLQAQEQWNLANCVEHALKNNVGLQQSKISVDEAALTVKENKHKQIPDLNGSINGGISFGRNIDPTSNSFTTENIISANYTLASGVTLFQGALIRNSIKQSKLSLDASTKEYQQATNDLALTIATYYLNVLLNEERLEMAEKNTENVKLQLIQMEKMIQSGVKPEADAIEIKSQLARMEQTQVSAENGLDIAWLTLKQAMRLDPSKKLILERLTEEQLNGVQLENYTFESLSETAAQSQSGLQAAYKRLEAARMGEKIAKALYYPSLFLNASIGSRFSDAAIRPLDYSTSRILVPGVYIDGKSVLFEQDYPTVKSTEVIPFKDQYDQFLGYGVGLNLNIPIYNQRSTKTRVQKAALATKSSELQAELQKEKLNQDVYQAIANVRAAKKEFEASKRALDATSYSADKTQKRFELGLANVFELNLSQTNLQNAQSTLVIAKYDLVFKQKVLDYYAGKPIKL